MAGTPKLLVTPVAMANGTYVTDIFTPPAATIYTVVSQIHVANVGAGALTFRLYKGASGANAAGTQLYYNVSVGVGSYINEYWNNLVLKSTDFLVGGASGADLVITVTGYQVVVP